MKQNPSRIREESRKWICWVCESLTNCCSSCLMFHDITESGFRARHRLTAHIKPGHIMIKTYMTSSEHKYRFVWRSDSTFTHHTVTDPPSPHTSTPRSPTPPVIYIYIELDAVVESEWRQPRLIIMGDYGPTAPPLCRVITKRESESGGWGAGMPRCQDLFHLGK